MVGFSGSDELMKKAAKMVDKANKEIKSADKVFKETEKMMKNLDLSIENLMSNKFDSDDDANIKIEIKGNRNSVNISTSNKSRTKDLFNIAAFNNKIKKDFDHIDEKDMMIKNIIQENIDILSFVIFQNKGFLAWFRCYIDLSIYYKENHNYDHMMSTRFSIMEKEDVPLKLLEILSQFYSEDLMNQCVLKNNNIHFKCFGFNSNVLKFIYTHYLKNRKRLLKGDIRTVKNKNDSENEKQDKLKILIKSLYK